ncbi:MAG TPA: 4-hydroxythreonine-4-phosphate dehydrogenase PdxA, partial [Betaproteobacteria bacterium]|nr:4-hydroxythreonine-4-phosphate dehydrogenase PdxA [Betaproteobacteria bacterium]
MPTRPAPVVALTAGEPAGIGPDLCVMLAQRPLPARVVVLADRELLEQRAAQLGLPLQTTEFQPGPAAPAEPPVLEVLHHPLAAPAQPGCLNPANSRALLQTL